MDTDLAALCAALYASHHVVRVRKAIALGREARTDPAALRLLDGLARGDAMERRLAVLANFTLRDGARVLAAVTDDSALVRGAAFRLVPLACDDGQALAALQVAWSLRRDRQLVTALATRGRHAAVDLWLDWLAQQTGVHDLADMVPLGTPAGILRHLARALERPSATFWERMAARAPTVLGDVFTTRMQSVAGEADPVTRQLVDRHLAALGARAPDEALGLLRLLLSRGIRPADTVIRPLVPRRPAEVWALYRQYSLTVSPGLFARVIHLLDDRSLAAVVTASPWALGEAKSVLASLPAHRHAVVVEAWASAAQQHPAWGTVLLGRLTDPVLRERAYLPWSVAVRDADGVTPVATVSLLPGDLREREARRHLHDVVALGTRPEARIAYARFLPWDEATREITAYLGHPEGATRGAALGVLLAIPGLRPAETTLADKAIALVLARKFEQDPVRGVMLATVSQWPRAVWRAEHLPSVARMVRDALDASDLSWATARSAEALVVRLFRLDPVWGATWLATLLRERGQLNDPRLGAHLTDEEVRAAAGVLLDVARTWSARERAAETIALAQSLGTRLSLVPGFFELLEGIRDTTPWQGTALVVMQLLASRSPARFDRALSEVVSRWCTRGEFRVLLLLADDRGIEPLRPALREALVFMAGSERCTHGEVTQALTTLRTRDLATFESLVPQLLARDVSYVILPVIHRHAHRFRQDWLDPMLGDMVITGRFATGHTRWVLPFTHGFFRWSPPQHGRFARTLAGLAADTGRDTPTVLWALTLLPGLAFTSMEPLAVMAEDSRPAVQEKSIRVMARCDAGQCVPTLLGCLVDGRARFAIYGLRKAFAGMLPGHVLRHLDAAPMHKVTIAKEVVRLLGELRSEGAYARLLALDATDLHRDVRIAMLRALWDHLEREPTWAVLTRAATGTDWVMASRVGDIPADRLTVVSDQRLSALLARVLDRPEPEARMDLLGRAAGLAVRDPARVFLTACASRLASPYDDEVRAAMLAVLHRADERDMASLGARLDAVRPDRRALTVAVDTLLSVNVRTRAVFGLAARAAVAVLGRDPRLSPLEVRAAAATMEPLALAAHLAAMGEGGRLDADAIQRASEAVQSLPPADLAAFEARLRQSASPEARRVAVWALVRDAGPQRGWTPERLHRLAELQSDPSPGVSGAAQRVFPPRETTATAGLPASSE